MISHSNRLREKCLKGIRMKAQAKSRSNGTYGRGNGEMGVRIPPLSADIVLSPEKASHSPSTATNGTYSASFRSICGYVSSVGYYDSVANSYSHIGAKIRGRTYVGAVTVSVTIILANQAVVQRDYGGWRYLLEHAPETAMEAE
jgi:hypothetical protein